MTALPLPYPRLPLPPGRAVYTRLHTDHYPWTEVTVDLAARQGQGLSGVFDAQQGPGWARFVWVLGTLRGGFTASGEVGWPAALAALPRAQVTLAAVEPVVADLVWASRAWAPQPLDGAWPGPQAGLTREGFAGVLLGGGACSFWEGGQPVDGTLPPPGAACTALPRLPVGEGGRGALLAFWADLIAAAHRVSPLDGAWREVSVRLSGPHPCLDPFAREVTVAGGRLHVDPDLPAGEFGPALLGAFQATLARLGLRLADLPLAELRTRPEWMACGLEGR